MRHIKILIPLIIATLSSCAQTDLKPSVYPHQFSGDQTPMQWPEPSQEIENTQKQSYYRPEMQTIYLGMPAEAVQSAWGIPGNVEYAGQDRSSFQRWHYPTSSLSGLNQSGRIVYIEHGRVVGWETLSGSF